MKFTNSAKLKAAIKKLANESNVPAQGILQKYVMERFLCRLSKSMYKKNFVLKGGFLTSSLVGVAKRTTMDIDATAIGLTVETETLEKILQAVCSVKTSDSFEYQLSRVEFIRELDSYPGFRIYLKASYGTLSVPFYMDITTGDAMTPGPIEQFFWSMFDDGDFELLAYNLETLLSEKLETILSRGVLNTRPRDFYDVDLLWNKYKKTIKPKVLSNALQNTMTHRHTENLLKKALEIVNSIKADENMNNRWKKYQKEYSFVEKKIFSEVCESIFEIMEVINLEMQ